MTVALTGSPRAARAAVPASALALLASLVFAADASGVPTSTITEFPIPTAESGASGIAPGPDGNVWFTESEADKIARISPTGAVTEFPLPDPESGPTDIVMGPDGNLWFTEHGSGKRERKGETIGRITPSGAVTEFTTRNKESGPEDITLGPDGNLWFTESQRNRIGRITPSGEVAEFPTEHSTGGIAAGPDGNVWFTEPGGDKIGVITPNGTIKEFEIETQGEPPENNDPEDITAGPDGNLWFTERNRNSIGRITPSGTITQFLIPTPNSDPVGIAAGPDGNVWFTEFGGSYARTIGRITPAGAISEVVTPTTESGPLEIAPGANGELWFTEQRKNQIGEISAGAPEPAIAPGSVTGGGLVGTPQTCNLTWNSWGSLQPSPSLFGFDGYQWLLNGSAIATGQSYTPTITQVSDSLVCTETATYPNPFLVTASAASPPVTVVAPPPTITAAHESASTWRVGHKLAQISRRRKAKAPPVGTTFSFVLNEPATVTFSFTQQLAGSSVHHKCVARTRKNAKHRGCRRTVTVGRLSFTGQIGTNQVVFQGRVSSRTKLAPGRYAVVILATNSIGLASTPVALGFTVAKG
jgi:streptogramin lyase